MLASLGITKDLIADLIINIGSIVVLFLIVKKLAYKPVKKFMDDRASRVASQREEAEKLSAESSERIAEYEVLLAECETAKAIAIREGEKEALTESERIITEAQKKAEEIIARAEKKAQEKYDRAIEDADDYIISIIMAGSSHLLARAMTDEDNRKIVEDFLACVKGESDA